MVCCASLQIYNLFPWLGPFLKNWRHLMKNLEENIKETKSIIADLKETLNPEMCRCFVDAFLTRKLNLEVSCPNSTESSPRLIIHTDRSLSLIPLFS